MQRTIIIARRWILFGIKRMAKDRQKGRSPTRLMVIWRRQSFLEDASSSSPTQWLCQTDAPFEGRVVGFSVFGPAWRQVKKSGRVGDFGLSFMSLPVCVCVEIPGCPTTAAAAEPAPTTTSSSYKGRRGFDYIISGAVTRANDALKAACGSSRWGSWGGRPRETVKDLKKNENKKTLKPLEDFQPALLGLVRGLKNPCQLCFFTFDITIGLLSRRRHEKSGVAKHSEITCQEDVGEIEKKIKWSKSTFKGGRRSA